MNDTVYTNPHIHLGHEAMDRTHDELHALIEQAAECKDAAGLATALDGIIEHTEQHFKQEEEWMEQCQFKLIKEHLAEHRQLMGEMNMMKKRLRPMTKGLVYSFIQEKLPDWLAMHLQKMDSLLASELNK